MPLPLTVKQRVVTATVIIIGLLLITLLPALAGLPAVHRWLGQDNVHGLQPNTPAPTFSLLDHSGTPVTLSQLTHKPLLLSFGYRHCAQTCPTQLATLKQIHQQLSTQVNYAWVSLDPHQDKTMPPLSDALNFANLVELFPSSNSDADQLLNTYLGQVIRQPSKTENPIAHSSYIYVVDTNDTLKVIYQGSEITADTIVDDMRLMTLIR